MAVLILPSRRVVQPQGPVEIAWTHPIARDLVCASVNIGSLRFDAVTRKVIPLAGSANPVGASSDGYGTNYNKSGYHTAPINRTNPTFASVFAVTRRTGTPNAFGAPVAITEPGEVNRALSFETGSGSFPNANTYFSAWNPAGSRFNLLASFELTPLDARQTIGVSAGGGVLRGFGNGVRIGSTTGPATVKTLSNLFTGSNSNLWAGFVPIACVWTRLLEDSEYQELHKNPWQLFRPVARRIWVPPSASGGSQGINQGTRLDSNQSFYSGTVTTTRTVGQDTRLDSAQTFYSGVVSQSGAAQSVTQAAISDNSQTFYGGVVTAAQVVTQGARLDNSQTFYGGVVTATQPVAQTSRFDNSQTFYGGIVLSGQPILQTVRFDNSQVFYGGDITGGAVVVANGLLVPPLRRRRR